MSRWMISKAGFWASVRYRQAIGFGVTFAWAYDTVTLYVGLLFVYLTIGYEWDGTP